MQLSSVLCLSRTTGPVLFAVAAATILLMAARAMPELATFGSITAQEPEESCKNNCICIAEDEIDDNNVTGDGLVEVTFPTVQPIIKNGCCLQTGCSAAMCSWDYGSNKIKWNVHVSIWTSTENMATQGFPPPNPSYTNIENVRSGYSNFQAAYRACGGTYHMDPIVALDVHGSQIGWAQLHLTCGTCVLPPLG